MQGMLCAHVLCDELIIYVIIKLTYQLPFKFQQWSYGTESFMINSSTETGEVAKSHNETDNCTCNALVLSSSASNIDRPQCREPTDHPTLTCPPLKVYCITL